MVYNSPNNIWWWRAHHFSTAIQVQMLFSYIIYHFICCQIFYRQPSRNAVPDDAHLNYYKKKTFFSNKSYQFWIPFSIVNKQLLFTLLLLSWFDLE